MKRVRRIERAKEHRPQVWLAGTPFHGMRLLVWGRGKGPVSQCLFSAHHGRAEGEKKLEAAYPICHVRVHGLAVS